MFTITIATRIGAILHEKGFGCLHLVLKFTFRFYLPAQFVLDLSLGAHQSILELALL